MAATSFPALLDGVAAQLDAIPGLNVNAALVDANMPVALVSLPSVPTYYEVAGKASFGVDIAVMVFVSKAIDQVGLRTLAAFADASSATSIIQALSVDSTQGGTVDASFVSDFNGLSPAEIAHYGYVGGIWTLKCQARGK